MKDRSAGVRIMVGLCALWWFIYSFIEIVILATASSHPGEASWIGGELVPTILRAVVVVLYVVAVLARRPRTVRGVLVAATVVLVIVVGLTQVFHRLDFLGRRDVGKAIVSLALTVYAHRLLRRDDDRGPPRAEIV